MNPSTRHLILAASISALVASAGLARPVIGPSFTYQGELTVSNAAYNGAADFRVSVWDAAQNGTRLGNPQFVAGTCQNGKFTIALNANSEFTANAFNDQARWIQIEVRTPGTGDATNPNGFTTLNPRQRVTAAPVAQFAVKAGDCASIGGADITNIRSANNLTGRVPSAVLAGDYNLQLNLTNDSNVFRGNGAGITNLSATNLTGTIQTDRLPSNVALLNRIGGQTFTTEAAFSAMLTADVNNLNDGTLNTAGLRFGSGSGEGIVSRRLAGANRYGLSFMTGFNPRMSLTNTGELGIGTDSPADLLHLAGPDASIRLQNTNDTVGAFMTDTYQTLQLGLFNPTAGDWGQVPANTKRSFFGVNAWGAVGSMDNDAGFPSWRNLLDDGAGRAGIGTDAPSAQLHVRGPGSFGNGGDGHNDKHVALFENTSASDGDGIAIKIDQQTTNRYNNFVTFYNGSQSVVGRIEGFDLQNGDWDSTPPPLSLGVTFSYPTPRPLADWFDFGAAPSLNNDGQLPGLNCSGGTINALGTSWCLGYTINPGRFPTFNTGRLPHPTGSPVTSTPFRCIPTFPTLNQLKDVVCWEAERGFADIVSAPAFAIYGQDAQALKDLYLQAKQLCRDDGVTYGSKGADYAEWLEKSDPKEDIKFGQIVGVRGGKITKDTADAEQVMVISRAPCVLGNVPESTDNYEKVAFMGQVPVAVLGKVVSGDYILASGRNDGFGVAVKPADLQPEHLRRIVGRAWADSANDTMSFVNVIIGHHAQAAAEVAARLSDQASETRRMQDALRAEFASLRGEVLQLRSSDDALSRLVQPAWPKCRTLNAESRAAK